MLLAAFGVLFLWVVQMALFEPGYINATIETFRNQFDPMASELTNMTDTSSLAELSKAVKGKVFMMDKNGKTFSIYSMGVPANLEIESDADQFLYKDRHYRRVINGNQVEGIINRGEPDMKVAMGFPVQYRGEPAALFLYSSLAELYTMQVMTRRQLVMLSAVLATAASFLALILTRHFTRPVMNIKDTVDGLAGGNLDVKPSVNRSDELGELAQSVEKLGAALQQVDVLRREVISNVSHELRSPLSLIVGYGEMVRDLTWNDDEKRNDNLNLIIDEASRLSRMVDDILDYSQIQTDVFKLRKEEWNFCELVLSEVEFSRRICEKWGISLRLTYFAEEISVKADAIKMAQVLRNLLSNAINHTEDGCKIDVSITLSGSGVLVSVANPGEFISEEDRKIIWERYQRAQHQGSRREGSGIGLSLVSAILSAHGFEYGVDSKNGQNIFWFIIPGTALA